ncbi:hypothetical protein CFP56_032635 [Quercus suber]|uniref:Uncharacterized protein n=1 Tax=Quercus suber TaxID=58331 RepID=A0AAW0JHS2_QUESU
MDKAIQCVKMVLNTCGFKKTGLRNSVIHNAKSFITIGYGWSNGTICLPRPADQWRQLMEPVSGSVSIDQCLSWLEGKKA